MGNGGKTPPQTPLLPIFLNKLSPAGVSIANANGVPSSSPGLIATAIYPGYVSSRNPTTLKGLNRPLQPFQGCDSHSVKNLG